LKEMCELIKVISCLLKSSHLDEHLGHPARLVRNQFSACSSKRHRQLLIDKLLPVKPPKTDMDDKNLAENFVESSPPGMTCKLLHTY